MALDRRGSHARHPSRVPSAVPVSTSSAQTVGVTTDALDNSNVVITDFRIEDANELVRMWRASFEHGVGIADPHPIEEQVAYLRNEVLPNHWVHVAREDELIVGFLACTALSISQLYVRVGHMQQGIGSQLLALAKRDSSGKLGLYTFARNLYARRFYEKHGFIRVTEGFEPIWQLEDVKYEWVRNQ